MNSPVVPKPVGWGEVKTNLTRFLLNLQHGINPHKPSDPKKVHPAQRGVIQEGPAQVYMQRYWNRKGGMEQLNNTRKSKQTNSGKLQPGISSWFPKTYWRADHMQKCSEIRWWDDWKDETLIHRTQERNGGKEIHRSEMKATLDTTTGKHNNTAKSMVNIIEDNVKK